MTCAYFSSPLTIVRIIKLYVFCQTDRDMQWYPKVDLICIFLIMSVIEHIKVYLLDISTSIGLCVSLLICKISI